MKYYFRSNYLLNSLLTLLVGGSFSSVLYFLFQNKISSVILSVFFLIYTTLLAVAILRGTFLKINKNTVTVRMGFLFSRNIMSKDILSVRTVTNKYTPKYPRSCLEIVYKVPGGKDKISIAIKNSFECADKISKTIEDTAEKTK